MLATQNPQRNSGSEPSRRPFGKTRSAGSPSTTSPFRGSTPTGASGRPRTASASRTCSPLPSSPTRRTRSLQSARPRRPAMTQMRKTAAPSGGGFTPVAFFSGRPCRREDGARFQKRSLRRILQQTLPWGGCERAAQRNMRRGFSLDPWKCPDARGSAHKIRSCPLVSQRPISVSIRLRRLYPFRAI